MAQRRKTLHQQGRHARPTRDILREVRGKEIHEQGRQENNDEHVRRLLLQHMDSRVTWPVRVGYVACVTFLSVPAYGFTILYLSGAKQVLSPGDCSASAPLADALKLKHCVEPLDPSVA